MRRRLFTILSIATAAAMAAACGGEDAGGPPTEEERAVVAAQLDSIYRVFSDAYRDASVERLMRDVYHDDAFYLPPGSAILEGQAAFRDHFAFLERFESGQGPDLSFEIVDRDFRDDLAYDIGYYRLRPRNAPAGAGGQGKFVVIWKRDPRGAWRIWADGFSPVNQGPGAGPAPDGAAPDSAG